MENGRIAAGSEGLRCPLVAVLSSSRADAVIGRNGLNFADLLAPFCALDEIAIKDPLTENRVRTKLKIDLRDIKRSGFLLSHTVLPHVLHENFSGLASSMNEPATVSDCSLFSQFASSFIYWFESADHDFLRCYMACMFVASSDEESPMDELERLTQQQHVQQTSSYNSSTTISPPHCASPKWMSPEILKYYVLVHDVSMSSEQRATEIFTTLVRKYGAAFCHLLRINSTADSGQMDLWNEIMDVRYRGLQPGLQLARNTLLLKTCSSRHSRETKQRKPSRSRLASLGSPTSISVLCDQMWNLSPSGLGQCLDFSDRQRIRNFVTIFAQNVLVPFVELQLSSQCESLRNRSGNFSRSLGGLGKWIGAITSAGSKDSSKASNSEYIEYQQRRRMADMAFQFGLYGFAHHIYQSLKKGFSNDQAWLQHAGGLEMSAYSTFLASNPASVPVDMIPHLAKDFPQRYLDNALNYYLKVGGQPMLALRSAIIAVDILSQLGLYTEAALQLVRLNSSADYSDLFSAVVLDHASFLFSQAGKRRKMAFYSMLAGHRFLGAGLIRYSQACFQRALPSFTGKGWEFAENHILNELSSYNESLLFGV